jgi:hypothetical protein
MRLLQPPASRAGRLSYMWLHIGCINVVFCMNGVLSRCRGSVNTLNFKNAGLYVAPAADEAGTQTN